MTKIDMSIHIVKENLTSGMSICLTLEPYLIYIFFIRLIPLSFIIKKKKNLYQQQNQRHIWICVEIPLYFHYLFVICVHNWILRNPCFEWKSSLKEIIFVQRQKKIQKLCSNFNSTENTKTNKQTKKWVNGVKNVGNCCHKSVCQQAWNHFQINWTLTLLPSLPGMSNVNTKIFQYYTWRISF